MISVIAERPPGDKQAPDVADPLITSEPVAIERGRNEIDASCSNREIVSSTGPLREYLEPGNMVEVADGEQQAWRGMIRTCAIVIDRSQGDFTASINLEIEREAP